MNKKKVMILGAGSAQIPIIKKAQEMGFYAIVVSIAGDYPGFEIADKSYEIDVLDKEAVLSVAKKESINGILTDQTDLPVTTVAYVAETMGLPGIGYECASKFRNKKLMRRLCQNIGIPVPRNFEVSTADEAKNKAEDLGYPLIIKPLDSQGSRGVAKICQHSEIDDKFQRARFFSSTKSVIIEEYFEGKEVIVDGFTSNYCSFNLTLGDKEPFNLPDLFIPNKVIYPSQLDMQVQEKLLSINTHLVNGFAPKFGITHNEYLVNELTGEIILVEAAIRGGGVFISSDLVPLACGIDVLSLLIEHATGTTKSTRLDPEKLAHNSSAFVCFYLPLGIICKIEGVKEIDLLPGVHHSYIQDFRIGQKTAPLEDKTSRLGPILVKGHDRKDCERTIKQVQETLIIEVDTGSGIRGIEW